MDEPESGTEIEIKESEVDPVNYSKKVQIGPSTLVKNQSSFVLNGSKIETRYKTRVFGWFCILLLAGGAFGVFGIFYITKQKMVTFTFILLSINIHV